MRFGGGWWGRIEAAFRAQQEVWMRGNTRPEMRMIGPGPNGLSLEIGERDGAVWLMVCHGEQVKCFAGMTRGMAAMAGASLSRFAESAERRGDDRLPVDPGAVLRRAIDRLRGERELIVRSEVVVGKGEETLPEMVRAEVGEIDRLIADLQRLVGDGGGA